MNSKTLLYLANIIGVTWKKLWRSGSFDLIFDPKQNGGEKRRVYLL